MVDSTGSLPVLGGSKVLSSTQLSLTGETGDQVASIPLTSAAPQQSVQEIRDQDRFLPVANISRIMKRDLPRNGKISKDAKECMQECASEFISFIASEASDLCQQEKRKTITGEDIITAMTALGFDNYIEPLKVLLVKCREYCKGPQPANGDRETLPVHESTQYEEVSAISLDTTGLLGQFSPFPTLQVIPGNPGQPDHDAFVSLTTDDLSAPVADTAEQSGYIILPPTQISNIPASQLSNIASSQMSSIPQSQLPDMHL